MGGGSPPLLRLPAGTRLQVRHAAGVVKYVAMHACGARALGLVSRDATAVARLGGRDSCVVCCVGALRRACPWLRTVTWFCGCAVMFAAPLFTAYLRAFVVRAAGPWLGKRASFGVRLEGGEAILCVCVLDVCGASLPPKRD